MDIRQKIKDLRLKKGWSTTELAKQVGLSQGYISDIENGRTNPSVKTLEKISKAFGVNPGYFLDRKKGIMFEDLIGISLEMDEFIKSNPEAAKEWLELALDFQKEDITPEDLKSILKIIRQGK